MATSRPGTSSRSSTATCSRVRYPQPAAVRPISSRSAENAGSREAHPVQVHVGSPHVATAAAGGRAAVEEEGVPVGGHGGCRPR